MKKVLCLLESKVSEEKFFFSGLFVFFLIFSQIVSAQVSENRGTIELNKNSEYELSGGQKHDFQINISVGQYAKIIVAQRGIDVVVRLLDSAGKVSVEYDAEPRINGEEIIEFTAKLNENLHLTIEPKQRSAKKGFYQIRLEELRLATEKETKIDETRKLLTQAVRLWRAGENKDALPLAERAVSIRENELGIEHSETGLAVFTLANIYSDLDEFERSESLYLRALAIREKALGKDHISIASILNNLGVLYKGRGDYVKAEQLYERVLKIREANLEPNHLLIASVLTNLANLISEKGENEKAVVFYKRALEIRENALGKDSAEVAVSLTNLANLYENIEEAEPLFRRSLEIKEKIYGADHQEVGQTLYNIARLYAGKGDFAKAEPLCRRSFEIFEKTLGAEHSMTSLPLNLLALIYKNTGEFEKAEDLFKQAIEIKKNSLGAFHPHLGGTYLNLANLYIAKGEIEKALEFQKLGNEIIEYNVELNLTAGSENNKFDYLRTLDYIANQTLALNFMKAKDSQSAINLGVTTVLQRKGRVLDAMSDSLSVLRRRFDKQDQILLDKLNEANTKLGSFVSDDAKNLKPAEYQTQIKNLEEEREKIEIQISQKSAGFFTKTKPILLKDIQMLIPKDSVLIEIAVFMPGLQGDFEFGAEAVHNSANLEKARYIAYIVPSNGAVLAKELGAVKEINEKLAEFRAALRDPKSKEIKRIGRAVDEKIMQPIRNALGGAKHILISPDGELNLIPFEALVDENGKYLIENFQFTYLTSGRDLLKLQTKRTSKSKPLIIAAPLFGKLSENSGGNLSVSQKYKEKIAPRDLSETYFAPLGGTLQEARAIKEIFPESVFLTNAEATEIAVKQISSPEILHIATHGFFLQDFETSLEKNADTAKRKVEINSKIENPLLRSGLAFAGANERKNGADNGILTALEASGLNLWGTKLVVLSACDTGLGEVKNGEGVFGLRRAFVLAGTESLVMSLWSVSDYVTRQLMTNYYKNLKQGNGRGESLRQVQLEMLKKNGREHPFFWASFIQSGEWANLEGVR